jgi:hypothetical protein
MPRLCYFSYFLLLLLVLFGFDAWKLVIHDVILGDGAGFGVPAYVKIITLACCGVLISFFRKYYSYAVSLFVCFILGIHVSFGQAGSLSGELFSVLPLGIRISVCHDDEDSALMFLEQSTTDDTNLASFQRTVSCEGKSGVVFSYAALWHRTGPV